MINVLYDKDPDARLPYQNDWAAWLGEDTLVTSEWIKADDEDEIVIESTSFTPEGSSTIWLSGGEIDTTYEITNRVETADGKIDDRTIGVRIVEK